ncbi:flavin-containing monooxygenase [Fredinandcohnia sp. 179-A 10B2 NHS]|uniref:flavin-containing monooxygenase n=1 Tax=Fredinandcohnia sp. 179-A 10B2 NHS TaxID=3235176 RepID=UPI0039A3DBC3
MYDVIVIGAGQAGLALGFFLKSAKLSFLLVDKGKEIGESWRNRYDSLTLFTPRMYSSLPGLPLIGDEQVYPTKDEIAEYLKQYADTLELPIQQDTEIISVSKHFNNGFKLLTSKGELESKNIVVATGPFQNPLIPTFANRLSNKVSQFHSSIYQRPSQLKNGPTLIVGGGNSGAQIAVELSKDREVFLSVSQNPTFLPQDFAGKSIFWWFDNLGILKTNVNTKLGAFIKKRPDPIFGYELKRAIKNKKVNIKARATHAENDKVHFQDGSELKIANVIWATGFRSDYSWLDIPSIFNETGFPIHKRGITDKKGLYFIGLPWQYRRGSALLQGVGYDAEYIVQKIVKEG